MTRLDWWLGIGLVVATLVFHAAFPRYEYRSHRESLFQIDRWTETARFGVPGWATGKRVNFSERSDTPRDNEAQGPRDTEAQVSGEVDWDEVVKKYGGTILGGPTQDREQ